MKHKHLFPLLLLFLGAFTFVACGDDDPRPGIDYPLDDSDYATIVGTYTGWTHLTTAFINKDYDGDTFTLAKADDGTLTATFTDATWGTATIKGIVAAQAEDHYDAVTNGKVYVMSGGEGSFVMNNPREQTTQEFPCQLENAILSGKTLTATIKANMEVGHGEMTFIFHTGERPQSEE